jgi:hypothetical protein
MLAGYRNSSPLIATGLAELISGPPTFDAMVPDIIR